MNLIYYIDFLLRQDFDTVAPPHNHYCADSGSKLRHCREMTAATLECFGFTFLLCKEVETYRQSFLQSMDGQFFRI